MVNTHTYILPSSTVSIPHRREINYSNSWVKTPELHLRCRLYSASMSIPCQVMMLTHCTGLSRLSQHFPVAESLLQDARMQPYVHDCEVTVHKGRHTYRFCIFFKRHCHLQSNPLLSTMGNQFRGNAVVMRVGGSSVVNMHGRDAAVADFMMS